MMKIHQAGRGTKAEEQRWGIFCRFQCRNSEEIKEIM